MTDLNNEVRELNIDELARVTGGEGFAIHGPGPVGPGGTGGETFDWGRRNGHFGGTHLGGQK